MDHVPQVRSVKSLARVTYLNCLKFCEKQKSRSGLFRLEPNAKRPKAPSHRETLHVQIPF